MSTGTKTTAHHEHLAEVIKLLGEVDDLVGYVPTEIKMIVVHMVTGDNPVSIALADLRSLCR